MLFGVAILENHQSFLLNQKQFGHIEIPYVTVVIPVYNEENCINDCILSLHNQEFKPIEIIVVDDGSKDNSVVICKKLGIKVLLQNHKGPGSARNLGARNAKGNILVFIDADMVFEVDYISKLVKPIINGKAIATSHWNEKVANWENPWARCQTWFQGLPDRRRQPIIVAEYEQVYRAVRKGVFLKVGGFSESEGRGDDSSIFRQAGIRAKIVGDAFCYHYNFRSLSEVLSNSIWHGRHIVVAKDNRFKRIVITISIYKNPIIEILRGLLLAIDKREPRMIPYSVLYTFGFFSGILSAVFSSNYLK